MKPVFIPLKHQYFEAFKSGHKKIEYRRVGGQFILSNCFSGREVTLSLGYGTRSRLQGTVIRSWVKHYEHPTGAIAECYGPEPIDIIAIEILVERDRYYRARCGDCYTAERWFKYLTRTKLLGKSCKIVCKGKTIVIEGLTKTQKRLLDCVTWVLGPSEVSLDQARQLANIPVIVQPIIPGLEFWTQPRETWAC